MNNYDKKYFEALLGKATEAAQAYYHSENMLMTDEEYDSLIEEIEDLGNKNPEWDSGAILREVAAGTTSNYSTVQHRFPMLSLEKAKTLTEVLDFQNRVDSKIVYEVKLDGLAVSILYENGNLKRMATRGDGHSGEDITNKLSILHGIPKRVEADGSLELRGEIFMSDKDFLKTNENRVENGSSPFLNPRNAVAGIIRSLDIGYEVFLSFACYDAISDSIVLPDYTESMKLVSSWGVDTAQNLTPLYDDNLDPEKILNLIEEKRPSLGFPIDGVVLKADSNLVREALGSMSNAPKWACAYKYSADTTTTILKDIEVAVGRTGQMSLRAVLEPVYVAGTTITYATLHNPKFISDADIRIGDTVYVYRAGDVIPRVDTVDISKRPTSSSKWSAPENCVRCGGSWDKSSLLWRCLNSSCSALGKLQYAFSRDALDIEGASSAVAEELINSNLVGSIADIYRLSVENLSSLNMGGNRLLGAKNATKIHAQIQASRNLTNDRIFIALGLRTLGRTLSRRILNSFPTLPSLLKATVVSLSEIEGIGKEKASIIVKEIKENVKIIEDLMSLNVGVSIPVEIKVNESLPLKGKIVVVSGLVPGYTRNEVEILIEKLGGRSAGSVSKNTSILISGEGSGTKYNRALELGVEVWGPQKFLSLI